MAEHSNKIAKSKKCPKLAIRHPHHLQQRNVGPLPRLNTHRSRIARQRPEDKRWWLGRPLHWPEGTRRPGVELAPDASGKRLVSVVPLLRGDGPAVGQDLEAAGHRNLEV